MWLLLPTLLALPLAVLGLAVAREGVRHTTLTGAWGWSVLALAGWLAVAIVSLFASAGTVDRAWYAAAVLTLVPLVHVLGARRPVVRSWPAFVLLPMLGVLGLPLVTMWGAAAEGAFEIEVPALVGYLLVLVMGTGNYFGTRFTTATLWLALGLATAVLAGSTARPGWLPALEQSRTIAVVAFALAAFSALRSGLGAPPSGEGEDTGSRVESLWTEFRDRFGIVWAKRVMDRVNESLEAASLDTRLDLDAIRWAEGERESAERAIVGTFAWLLKRFVDAPWAARFGIELRERPDPSATP